MTTFKGPRDSGQTILFVFLRVTVLLACTASTAFAGTAKGSIDRHNLDLTVSCNYIEAQDFLTVTSEDKPSTKDTNGDGIYLQASGTKQMLAIVFHVGDEIYKFGSFNVDIKKTGFNINETMSRKDKTEYRVSINVSC